MPQKEPLLDNRIEEDIKTELADATKKYVEKWSSGKDEAGLMLHRIFAAFVKAGIDRINGVPEKNMFAFLETAGVSRGLPAAAVVPLTFRLMEGQGPMLIPKGTQASASSGQGKAPVTFETVEDLAAIPSEIEEVIVADPVWDRVAVHRFPYGPKGFEVFKGDDGAAHTLYLGDDALLGFDGKAVVELRNIPGKHAGFFEGLVYRFRINGNIAGMIPVKKDGKNGYADLKFTFAEGQAVDSETISSDGNRWESRYMRISLPAAFNDSAVPEDLDISGLTLKVYNDSAGDGLVADRAFCNKGPVEAGGVFKPYGDIPAEGDILYISCKEAFSKPNVSITLDITLQQELDEKVVKADEVKPDIVWEYWDNGRWREIKHLSCKGDNAEEDHVKSFRSSGKIEFPENNYGTVEVNGVEAAWLRARIRAGDYGKPLQTRWDEVEKKLVPVEGTGTLKPPVIKMLSIYYHVERKPPVELVHTGFSVREASSLPDGGSKGFGALPEKNPSMYMGLNRCFPGFPATLYVSMVPGGYTETPYQQDRQAHRGQVLWEYFDGIVWKNLNVIDSTNAFTRSGAVKFIMPGDIKPAVMFDLACTWIRVSKVQSQGADIGKRFMENNYFHPSRVYGIFINTVTAIQGVSQGEQVIGSSNGTPGQRMAFPQIPVLEGQQVWVLEEAMPSDTELKTLKEEEGAGEVVKKLKNPYSGKEEVWVLWKEVSNFVLSEAGSRHYTLEHMDGTLTFGNGTRGFIPPKGGGNVRAVYRTGGGMEGNVGCKEITLLNSTLPGAAGVINHVPAGGGAEVEPEGMIKERGPQVIRSRKRAVSHKDYEWMVRQAAGTAISVVKCLPGRDPGLCSENGWVTLVIVPCGSGGKLYPAPELVKKVEDYIKASSFMGVADRIKIIGPGYIKISTEMEVIPDNIAMAQSVKEEIEKKLTAFFSPAAGDTGWGLGKNVYLSDICSMIEGIPHVDHISLDSVKDRLKIRGSIIQQRVFLAKEADFQITPGSIVGTSGGSGKRAEAALGWNAPDGKLEYIDITAFKEGDRVTLGVDVEVYSSGKNKIQVCGARDELARFPSGSLISTPSGKQYIWVKKAFKDENLEIELDRGLDESLEKGAVITALYPFPVLVEDVIEKVACEGEYVLLIEPAVIGIEIPLSVFHEKNKSPVFVCSLDGNIRLPLTTPVSKEGCTDSLGVRGFEAGELVRCASQPDNYEVGKVGTIYDVVYLKSNYLVYSGNHSVTVSI